MIFVAVTLSIVAVMAAVTMPNLVTYHKQQDAELTAKTLESLDSTLRIRSAGSFLGSYGAMPAFLHQLVLPIQQGDPKCNNGSTFKLKTDPQKWLNNAPFSGVVVIPDYGVPTPLGFIHDSILNRASNNGDAEMHIDSLDQDAVELLDIAIDDGDGANAGVLRYEPSSGTSAAHPLYLARYWITSTGCP